MTVFLKRPRLGLKLRKKSDDEIKLKVIAALVSRRFARP